MLIRTPLTQKEDSLPSARQPFSGRLEKYDKQDFIPRPDELKIVGIDPEKQALFVLWTNEGPQSSTFFWRMLSLGVLAALLLMSALVFFNIRLTRRELEKHKPMKGAQ